MLITLLHQLLTLPGVLPILLEKKKKKKKKKKEC